MFNRSVPFHGGIEHLRDGRPDGARGGGGGRARRRGVDRRVGRVGRVGRLVAGLVVEEDAAAGQRVLGDQVVPGDDDVGAGHHQEDRGEPGERQRAARQPDRAEPAVARGGLGVHVLGDAIRVDDGDQAIDQDHDIDPEDAADERGVEGHLEQVQAVHPQEEPAAQGDQEDRRRREGERAQRRTGVELAEAGEDQGQECRREGGLRTRPSALRVLHRA